MKFSSREFEDLFDYTSMHCWQCPDDIYEVALYSYDELNKKYKIPFGVDISTYLEEDISACDVVVPGDDDRVFLLNEKNDYELVLSNIKKYYGREIK